MKGLVSRPLVFALTIAAVLCCVGVASAAVVTTLTQLAPTDVVANPFWGKEVALSSDGRTVLVSGLTGNGGPGAVWVFVRSGASWSQQARINIEGGVAVSADGNTALIGHRGTSTYVFARSGGDWTQQTIIPAGGFLALSGDGNTAVVGGVVFAHIRSTWLRQASLAPPEHLHDSSRSVALSDDGNTALLGFPNDHLRGAVWAFVRSGGVWTQMGGALTLPHARGHFSNFGFDLALSGDGSTALVGALGDSGSRGSAVVFRRSHGTWKPQGPKLTGREESGVAFFGQSVALSRKGDRAAIGGLGDHGGAGAVWVFQHSNARWRQVGRKVIRPGTAFFGATVGISATGGTVAIGASYLLSSTPGTAWVFGSG
jgi:hypothetical protein